MRDSLLYILWFLHHWLINFKLWSHNFEISIGRIWWFWLLYILLRCCIFIFFWCIFGFIFSFRLSLNLSLNLFPSFLIWYSWVNIVVISIHILKTARIFSRILLAGSDWFIFLGFVFLYRLFWVFLGYCVFNCWKTSFIFLLLLDHFKRLLDYHFFARCIALTHLLGWHNWSWFS